MFVYETAALLGRVPHCSTRKGGESRCCGEALASVSPAEGARDTSSRCAGGGPGRHFARGTPAAAALLRLPALLALRILPRVPGGPKARTTVGRNKVALMKNLMDKALSKMVIATGKRACKLIQA